MRINNAQARELGIIPKPPSDPQAKEERREQRKARERLILAYALARGLPVPEFEYPFAAPDRQWRFDMLFEGWLAVEVQGGLFIQGRHSRGPRLLGEHEKLNEAVIRGYAVVFCTPQDVESGAIFATVEKALLAGDRP